MRRINTHSVSYLSLGHFVLCVPELAYALFDKLKTLTVSRHTELVIAY